MTMQLTGMEDKLATVMAELEANYTKLAAKDHGFALSLIEQYKKKKSLSPKQQHWAEKLVTWATQKKPHSVTPNVAVGDFSGVYALFAKAKEHLLFPKIRLMLPDQTNLTLALSGSKSKVPGVVNLTDGGKYGKNVWYGRVYPEGKFEAAQKIDADKLKIIEDTLKKLAVNPAETVAEHGKLTGNCSFCDSPLSHDNSTAVGYGPVCAKNFGLYAQWKVAAKNAGLNVPNGEPPANAVVKASVKKEKKAFPFDDAFKKGKEERPQAKKKLVQDKEQGEYLF